MSDFHIVVGYLKDQIVDYLKSGSQLGVRIRYIIQDNIGHAEDAIRISLSNVNSRNILYVCADDLLELQHLYQLVNNLHTNIDGVMLAKTILDATVPRLLLGHGKKIIGTSENPYHVLMLYNFAIRAEVLRDWMDQLSGRKEALVHCIEQILTRYTLLTVQAEDLLTLNTIEQLGLAEQRYSI